MDKKPITVIGGTSLIGKYLLAKLRENGHDIQALTRQPIAGSDAPGLSWHRIDQHAIDISRLATSSILIYLAPNWTLANYLPQLVSLGIKRIIVFSSTSQFTKKASSNQHEQAIVKRLVEAEQQIKSFCDQQNIAWTIFRPTLIYGDMSNNKPISMGKGLATMVRFIKLCRLFPLVTTGSGLRQPVHAIDLAAACIAALDNPKTYHKAYNLSGAEVLSYQQMVARIFIRLGMQPRFLRLPLPLLRGILQVIKLLPRYRFLTLEMANRMNQDMAFEYLDAQRDFDYKPRKFLT